MGLRKVRRGVLDQLLAAETKPTASEAHLNIATPE
jgi:hypothetical protein